MRHSGTHECSRIEAVNTKRASKRTHSLTQTHCEKGVARSVLNRRHRHIVKAKPCQPFRRRGPRSPLRATRARTHTRTRTDPPPGRRACVMPWRHVSTPWLRP